MRARRTAVAVAALWWGALLAPPAWAGAPSEQLLASIDRVLKILDNAELKQPPRAQERREAIRRSAGDIPDFAELAHRSLAPHWEARTPAAREELVPPF